MMGIWGGTYIRPVIPSVVLAGLLSLVLTGTTAAILVNIKLSGSLVTDGAVDNFAVSPDERYVVFLADAHIDEMWALLSTDGTWWRLPCPFP